MGCEGEELACGHRSQSSCVCGMGWKTVREDVLEVVFLVGPQVMGVGHQPREERVGVALGEVERERERKQPPRDQEVGSGQAREGAG